MSPILLSRLEIDDERWNNAVATSEQNTIYARSWYLDVVCEDWNAIIWPNQDSYKVILPLPVIKKWGIRVIQQPLFCQYLGFFYQNEVPGKLISDFLALMDSRFSYISAYSFSPFNYQIVSDILPEFVNMKSRRLYTNWLDLNRPYSEIHQAYSKDRKMNLERGRDLEWEVVQRDDISPLLILFKENHEQKIKGGVDERAYAMFTRLRDKIKLNAHSELWYAVLDEKIRAGVLIVRSGNFAVYLFNAADNYGRMGNARSVLLDNYFLRNAGEAVVFDFESPEVARVASFYRSFGGGEKSFISIQKNELPFPFKQIQNWRRKLLGIF